MKNKPVIVVVFAALLASFCLTGCQTSEGIGRDVEDLGEEIQEGARDAAD